MAALVACFAFNPGAYAHLLPARKAYIARVAPRSRQPQIQPLGSQYTSIRCRSVTSALLVSFRSLLLCLWYVAAVA